jgi:hypothetical protein
MKYLREKDLAQDSQRAEGAAVSYVVTPFEVISKALGRSASCRFVHLYPAIATRHSDTIDCVFLVDGRKATVAISCAGIKRLLDHDQAPLSDQQLAEIAALHLRKLLEQGYDPADTELFVGEEKLRPLAKEMGFI